MKSHVYLAVNLAKIKEKVRQCSNLYATAGSIAATAKRLPTKLMGNLS